MTCRSVDFPEPLGPVMAYFLPLSKFRSVCLKIHSLLKRLPASVREILIHAVFRESLDDTSSAFPDECDDLLAFIGDRYLLFYEMNGLSGIHPLVIDIAIDVKDMIDFFDRESFSLKADRIYTRIAEWLPACLDIGRHILTD